MGNITTRGRVEEIAVSTLEERGWTIMRGDRQGLDLDLSVRFEGTEGKVLFRNALSAPKGMEESAETDPCFVRIELGEPTGEPTRWSLWDSYEFKGSKESPKYIATIVHEAIGDGWTIVAGGDVEPGRSWYDVHRTLKRIISRAECLAPNHEETDRRRELWKTQRHNFSAQEKKIHPLLWGFLFFMFCGPSLLVSSSWLEGIEVTEQLIGATVVATLLLLGFIGIVTATLIRRARRPREPVDGMDAVVETFRATGMFDTFELTAAKVRDGLPVVVQGSYLDEGRAPLTLSRVTATSSKHNVTLDADLCLVRWPDRIASEARFLPDRWLTMDLTGPPEELAKIPSFHRSDQWEDQVRWLFSGRDLDDLFEDLLRTAATSLTGTTSPYR